MRGMAACFGNIYRSLGPCTNKYGTCEEAPIWPGTMCMSPAKHPRGPTFIKPVSGCSSILLRSKKITLVALKPVHRSCRLCTSGKGGAKACHTESLNIQAHQPKRVFSTFMSDRDFHREGRKMRKAAVDLDGGPDRFAPPPCIGIIQAAPLRLKVESLHATSNLTPSTIASQGSAQTLHGHGYAEERERVLACSATSAGSSMVRQDSSRGRGSSSCRYAPALTS